MKLLFVCGGSAGHINPAIAIAEEMRNKRPDCEILFVGADKALEKKLIPDAGFKLVNIKMSGLRRGFSPEDIAHNIKTAINLFIARFETSKLLKKYKPDIAVGTGGYICYPVIKKTVKAGIPSYLLEPNAYPGLAVRLLSGIVDKIFVTYKGDMSGYKKPERLVYTGTPLRKAFLETAATPVINKQDDKPLVISYWGSLGAAGMNNKMLEFIKRNISEGKFNHIHATGINSNADEMKEKIKNLGVTEVIAPAADIREYINDMSRVMGSADIVLSRAGASTIVELTALGKPAILIPSPNVTENHQEENAKHIQAAGGAIMIAEKDCTGNSLYETVSLLLDDKNKLMEMSDAMASLSVSDASEKIVEMLLTKGR